MADTLAFWQKTQYYLSGYDAAPNIGQDHSPYSRNPVSYTGSLTQPAYYITFFDEGANTSPTNIKVPINSASSFSFGTDDFTIEASFYAAYSSSVIAGYYTLNGDGWRVLMLSNKLVFQVYNNEVYTTLLTSTASVSTSTWYNFAFVRTGSTLKLYISGTLDSSVSCSNNFNGTATYFYVGDTPTGTNSQGIDRAIYYLNKLRITTDDRYSANYTPPDYYILWDFGPPLTIIDSKSLSLSFTDTPAYTHMYTFPEVTEANLSLSFNTVNFYKSADSFWNQTQLLTHLNDLPSALDASLKDRNPAVISGGLNVSQGVFYAALISASPGNISYPITSSTGASFGTGDFTVEGWFYSFTTNQRLLGHSPSSGTGWRIVIDSSGVPLFQSVSGGSYSTLLSGGSSVNGGWNYFGFQRKNGILSYFRNGTPNITTISDSTDFNGDGGSFVLGTPPAGENSSYPNASAYIDEVRITSAARYSSSSFTYIANGGSQPEGWKVKVIPPKAVNLSFNEVVTHATNITLSPDTLPVNLSFNPLDAIANRILEISPKELNLSFNDATASIVVNYSTSVSPLSLSLSYSSVIPNYSKDQYWDKVVFLSNFNTATLPIDLSPHNRVLIPFGTTPTYQAGTSSYLTAASGDNGFRVDISSGTNFSFGTGDFTIEGVLADAQTSTHFISYITPSGDGWRLAHQAPTNLLVFEKLTSGVGTVLSQESFNALDWRHVVIQRRGSNFEMYYQGTRFTQVSDGGVNFSGDEGILSIGGSYSSSETDPYAVSYINIDSLRITKGVARYSTPTITALTNGYNYLVGYGLSLVPTKGVVLSNNSVDLVSARILPIDTLSYSLDYSLLSFNDTYAVLTSQVDYSLSFNNVSYEKLGAVYPFDTQDYSISFNDLGFGKSYPIETLSYEVSFFEGTYSYTKTFFDRSYDLSFNEVSPFFNYSSPVTPLELNLSFEELLSKEISPVSVDSLEGLISFNEINLFKSISIQAQEYLLDVYSVDGFVNRYSTVDLLNYDISFYGTDVKEISPLPIDNSDLNISFNDVEFFYSTVIPISQAELNLSFNDPDFRLDYSTDPEVTEYSLSFNGVEIQSERFFQVTSLDYSLSFNDVAYEISSVEEAPLFEVSLSFNNVSLTLGTFLWFVSVPSLSYSSSFTDVAQSIYRNLIIPSVDYSLELQPVDPIRDYILPLDSVSYSVSYGDVTKKLKLAIPSVDYSFESLYFIVSAPQFYVEAISPASYTIEYFPSFGVYTPPYLYAPAAKIYIR